MTALTQAERQALRHREERIMSGGHGLVEHPRLPIAVRNYLQRRRKSPVVA
jgi:hypothetical protein